MRSLGAGVEHGIQDLLDLGPSEGRGPGRTPDSQGLGRDGMVMLKVGDTRVNVFCTGCLLTE